MRDAGGRPTRRLCCWVLGTVMASVLAAGAAPRPQSNPATTTVTDTVYNANGNPAQGSLIITWPSFVTASGAQVASGSTTVPLAANGTFSVALVPNAGATPAGVYYTVVLQIGPGQVTTEYWVVPTTSPANLAAVQVTPGSGVAGAAVSIEYVNSALAGKANDNAVVHLSGTETISGVKTFAAAPNVPAPVNAGDVANKAYVDQSVTTVGSGNYLSTAGGTMTGPIVLPANPVSSMQATPKQYVDSGLSAKADLVSGTVPASELGAGQAAAGTCLQGNGTTAGTWGACGTGTGNLSTAPVGSQTIAQPAGTQFAANNLANIRYVTASWNWSQQPADNLSAAGAATIHLSPCPLGIDTAASANYYSYDVYISGTGTAEAVPVTGGSCTAGAASGTITVTTAYAHAAGYTVGSATGGIQEAWNDAWVNDQGAAPNANSQAGPYVKLTADTPYNVHASIYLRGRGGVLDGAGALLVCSTRDRCIYIGTTQGTPYVNHHKLYNLSGTSTVNVDGVQVASVTATSGGYTVTTASAHPFVAGDTVDCEYHTPTADQHWSSLVTGVPNSTSFTVSFGHATFVAGAPTFGFCNLLNTFIEDNSDHVVVQDVNIFQSNPAGLGYFSYGIVDDNDQEFIIERASNRSSLILNATANWPIGAFVYQRTDQANAGIVYLHDSEITGVNCVAGGGNGMVVTDTVCQGFPVYGIKYLGGLQPVTLQNIYEESTGATVNPLYGYAAQEGFALQGGVGNKIVGSFPVSGYEPGFATGGGSAAERTYFVVPRSSTLGYGPVLFVGWAEPASGTTNIPLEWPSVALENNVGQSVGTLTWDVLVTTGTTGTPPWGSGMYAIATNISGSCGTNGMCSFTDTQAAPTAYTVAAQQFIPSFWFWPVNLVINNATVLMEQIGAEPGAVASQGTLGVSIVGEQCRSMGVSRRRSPIWISCLTSEPSGGSGSIATVLQEQDTSNAGPAVNSKGRLNFGKAIGTPNDLITLMDSNPGKTLATAGQRPSNDSGDMAMGEDQTNGLSLRAGSSISNYINVVPTGTNWVERLTNSAKSFQVPVTTTGGITGASLGPFSGTAAPLCIVDGTNNPTIAACEAYLGRLGFANSGTIWSFVPEDFTSDPFVNFHGTIVLGHQTGTGDTCATTAPFNCWLTEVPLTLPTHLTVMGQQNPSRSQGAFNAGSVISFGNSYPPPLGVPANAMNWTGTGNHTPDFSCAATGGSLANGTYYAQVWEALDRTGGTGGTNATPGYSAATAEAAVTCANGGSTQSITFHAPTAAGSGNFVAKDFFVGTATAAAINGAGQEQSNLVGTQWTCPGAAGTLDATFGCTIAAGVATIKVVPTLTAASGNPPPLVDLSTCLVAFGTGVPGVSTNSFGVKLQHLTLSGMGGGTNTTTPAANEPSCALLGWTAQEQSGPEDITFTGPWINTAFYSGYKSGNSYARGLHMPSNEGPGQTGQVFYPVIVDGRGLGNGGIRTLEDSTIAMRCSGCAQQPTEPYSVWMTGNTVAVHAHGIHVENDVGGDGFFVDNLASLDLSGVTGFADVNHYLTHFTATADPSCVMETKVGKNGGVADDAVGFTNTGFNQNSFRYCTQLSAGSVTVTGQLQVAGPWAVSSPVPGNPMAAAATGTSALGISNDGNFYISANGGTPQKVATTGTSSYFSNLFQEDANDLGEYNPLAPTTAQNLRVYTSGSANASSWQRTTVGYDATNNLAAIKSENSTPASALGLEFWIGSSAKWEIDATGNLKPFTNGSFNVGSTTYAPQTVYAAASLDTLTQGRENFEICNDGTTGTALNFLAIYNGATPACAVKAGTANTDGVIGVVSNGSGTSGNAVITYRGYVPCSFDGATTAGDYVVASTNATYPGDCHDAGGARPTGVQVLGRVESTNAGAGTYGVRVSLDAPGGTGAAPLASPQFTGTPTAPTPTAGDNSTKIATTAYVRSEVELAWTCPLMNTAGGSYLSASTQYCNWTLPAGITITGFDLSTANFPTSCTTYPVVQVWDATSSVEVGSFSQTMDNATNFFNQVTGSASVSSGHKLRMKVTTVSSGCSGNNYAPIATVTYQMQN